MTQFVFITDEQVLRKVIREEIAENQKNLKSDLDPAEKFYRRKAANFLGISYQTMCNWVKAGIVTEHGHGRKKYFLRSELIESMQNNG